MKKKILIVYNAVSPDAGNDESDVLEQAGRVEKACIELGYTTGRLAMDLNLQQAMHAIRQFQPDILFNLVESLDNRGEFTFIANSLFNALHLPYSGSPLIPMFFTSNKILAKECLSRLGISTPRGFLTTEMNLIKPSNRYILKPVWEEGSLDLDEESVFRGRDEQMKEVVRNKSSDHYFVEEYIEGREFNISLLAGENGPEVLPLAEMQFLDYPDEKPRILGYASKWDPSSFEYARTVRSFDIRKENAALCHKLRQVCHKIWTGFGLCGYARIDFRVSANEVPFVIDVNANPCLSLEGGFEAALNQAGISFAEAIRRILEDATRNI